MILTLFGWRAFFGIKKQSRALASMVLKKTPVREQLATGGGGANGNFSECSDVNFFLSCVTHNQGGGGWCVN